MKLIRPVINHVELVADQVNQVDIFEICVTVFMSKIVFLNEMIIVYYNHLITIYHSYEFRNHNLPNKKIETYNDLKRSFHYLC